MGGHHLLGSVLFFPYRKMEAGGRLLAGNLVYMEFNQVDQICLPKKQAPLLQYLVEEGGMPWRQPQLGP